MRQIKIENKIYNWKVGKSNTVIVGDGKKFVVPHLELCPNEDIERAKWKNYFHITPSIIKEFLNKRLK